MTADEKALAAKMNDPAYWGLGEIDPTQNYVMVKDKKDMVNSEGIEIKELHALLGKVPYDELKDVTPVEAVSKFVKKRVDSFEKDEEEKKKHEVKQAEYFASLEKKETTTEDEQIQEEYFELI